MRRKPVDRLTQLPKPATSVEARTRLLDLMRRDLIGPHPDLDPDLAREVLAGSSPSTWYLTGYLGPRRSTGATRRLAVLTGSEVEGEEVSEGMMAALRGSEGMELGAPGKDAAPDEGVSERPPTRSFEASSMGLRQTGFLPDHGRLKKRED